MNLWMFGDNVSTAGPSNGQPHELVLGSFTYTPDPVPSDFNEDGDVDASDFQEWRQTFGSTVMLSADGNGDGTVNAADYTVWRDNVVALALPTGNARTLQQQVPEPKSIIKVCCTAVFTFVFRW